MTELPAAMHPATHWQHTEIAIRAAAVPVRNATLEAAGRQAGQQQHSGFPGVPAAVCRPHTPSEPHQHCRRASTHAPASGPQCCLKQRAPGGVSAPGLARRCFRQLWKAAAGREEAPAGRPAGRELNSSERCRGGAAAGCLIMASAGMTGPAARGPAGRPPHSSGDSARRPAGARPAAARRPPHLAFNLPHPLPAADARHGAAAADGRARAAAAAWASVAAATGRPGTAVAAAAGSSRTRHRQAHAAAGAQDWGQHSACLLRDVKGCAAGGQCAESVQFRSSSPTDPLPDPAAHVPVHRPRPLPLPTRRTR